MLCFPTCDLSQSDKARSSHSESHVQYIQEPQMTSSPPPSERRYVETQIVRTSGRGGWSWVSLMMASMTMWFCFPPFGYIAVLYSIISYVDYRSGYIERSVQKRRCACGWIVASFIFGILVIGIACFFIARKIYGPF